MAAFKALSHWVENKSAHIYLKLSEKDDLNHLSVLRECETLHIQSSSLRTIPEQLKDYVKLQKLYFYNCPISTITSFIFYLPSLELLHFKNCIVSKTEYQAGQSQIKNFKINQGLLKEIPPVIASMQQLKELDLGSNQIQKISKELYSLHHLNRLNLESNQIQSITQDIFQMKNLKSICLDNNPLDQATKDLFMQKIGKIL
jgi:Leucine-rich repeat (LRR) protein